MKFLALASQISTADDGLIEFTQIRVRYIPKNIKCMHVLCTFAHEGVIDIGCDVDRIMVNYTLLTPVPVPEEESQLV